MTRFARAAETRLLESWTQFFAFACEAKSADDWRRLNTLAAAMLIGNNWRRFAEQPRAVQSDMKWLAAIEQSRQWTFHPPCSCGSSECHDAPFFDVHETKYERRRRKGGRPEDFHRFIVACMVLGYRPVAQSVRSVFLESEDFEGCRNRLARRAPGIINYLVKMSPVQNPHTGAGFLKDWHRRLRKNRKLSAARLAEEMVAVFLGLRPETVRIYWTTTLAGKRRLLPRFPS